MLTPAIFGTFQRTTDEIATALKLGFNTIDTATGYNNSSFIREAIKLSNTRTYILTKYNQKDFLDIQTASRNHDTDLGQIPDIVLIHTPLSTDAENVKAFESLRALYPKQLVGISNFNIAQIQYLIDNQCHPDVISLEFSPYYQPIALIKFCEQQDILITGYRPTCKGRIYSDEKLKDIKDITNTVLNWVHNKNIIPIVSSKNEEHIKDMLHYHEVNIEPPISTLLDSFNEGSKSSSCMLKYTTHDE
jgi:diketogulonate reductase-like aldo/keto reductase